MRLSGKQHLVRHGRGRRTSGRHVLLLLLFLLGIPNVAYAQASSVRVPENAHAKGYGSGWECDRGYRESAGTCLAIKIPENAFSTNSSYGTGWECSWGYRQADDRCAAIMIPKNAYLNSFGDKWKCDRGFRVDNETCVALSVPVNAHIDFSGNDWECNRPYRKQRSSCVLH
ncbi:MAG: hypothetical protein GKS00_28480 [Alphaproteobacteria bacterium]|nr:hypothetical protein [Alphaproteobacteria bacterium]